MKWTWRVLHGFVVVATGVAAGLVIFGLLSTCFFEWASSDSGSSVLFHGLWLLMAVLIAAGLARRISYRVLLPALVLFVGLSAYFLYDIRQPVLPEIGPVISWESDEYRSYAWMLKDSAHSRVSELPKPSDARDSFWGKKPDQWRAHMSANRAQIISAFEADQVGRLWIESLAEKTPRGVFLIGLKDRALDISAVRGIYERRLAYAGLLAGDGKCDEAVLVLIPALKVGYFLQDTGGSLLSQMMPQIFVGKCYELLGFIADQGPVGEDTNSRVRAMLEAAVSPKRVFRNIFNGEAYAFHDTLGHIEKGLGVGPSLNGRSEAVRFLQRMIYNPHLTERSCFSFYRELLEASVARDLERVGRLGGDFEQNEIKRFSLKNATGRMVKAMAIPSFGATVKKVWEIEDQRLALVARLEGR